MKKSSSKNKGFTLFELLAVLAILSIIAAIAVPRVMQTIKNARIEALKSNMQLIANSMQRYVTEKELTSCVGGMFVINQAYNETDVISNSKFYFNGTTLQNATGTSIHNITVVDQSETDSIAKEIANDYIEGGIPSHIRVLVYADSTGKGNVVVSYGNVDKTPSTTGDDTKVVLINGITPQDLGEAQDAKYYQVTKTFELDSGEGHKHETDDN